MSMSSIHRRRNQGSTGGHVLPPPPTSKEGGSAPTARTMPFTCCKLYPYACFLKGAKTASIRCLPYASQEHLTNKLGV